MYTGDKTIEERRLEFIEQCTKLHDGKYSYINFVYVTVDTKSFITCPDHGDFEQSVSDHRRPRGCPACKSSKLELAWRKQMKEMEIEFSEQKRFSDCKKRYTLPFDFEIIYNDEPILIELDGDQHFYPSRKFKKEKHEEQIVSDHIKTLHCVKNKKKLLRISYREIDKISDVEYVKKILKKFRFKRKGRMRNRSVVYSNKKLYSKLREHVKQYRKEGRPDIKTFIESIDNIKTWEGVRSSEQVKKEKNTSIQKLVDDTLAYIMEHKKYPAKSTGIKTEEYLANRLTDYKAIYRHGSKRNRHLPLTKKQIAIFESLPCWKWKGRNKKSDLKDHFNW